MNIEKTPGIGASLAKGLALIVGSILLAFLLVFIVVLGINSDEMGVSVFVAIVVFVLAVFIWGNTEKSKSDPKPKIYETDPLLLSPIEYEEYCAELLKSAGWDVSTTKASGDQGADVVAVLRGIRAVVQCKRYGSKVGNRAVQEAVAAKAHYGAQIAVVVCPLGYTRAAHELAKSNRAILLGHNELANLENIAQIPLSPI